MGRNGRAKQYCCVHCYQMMPIMAARLHQPRFPTSQPLLCCACVCLKSCRAMFCLQVTQGWRGVLKVSWQHPGLSCCHLSVAVMSMTVPILMLAGAALHGAALA